MIKNWMVLFSLDTKTAKTYEFQRFNISIKISFNWKARGYCTNILVQKPYLFDRGRPESIMQDMMLSSPPRLLRYVL